VFLTCNGKGFPSFAKRGVYDFWSSCLLFSEVAGVRQIGSTIPVAMPISCAMRRTAHVAWLRKPHILERKEPVITVLAELLLLRIESPDVEEVVDLQELAEA